MAATNIIRYWNRESKSLEIEKVYGDDWIRLLYGTPAGVWITDRCLAHPWISRAYGWLQSSSISKSKIASFIKKFSIRMEEYEVSEYSSFNDFFIRQFRPGLRSFSSNPNEFCSPAEARLFVYPENGIDQKHRLKGSWVSVSELLGKSAWTESFKNGSVMILRLCPVDYHRFHFPDDGTVLDQYTSHGKLHSVNPVALRGKPDILFTNERQISILETKNFGKVAYIEVGALCVGKIVQTHLSPSFNRGDEKGYFLFGGSTVVVLTEPGRVEWDPEIIEKTNMGIETFVKLGSTLGTRK